MMNKTHICTSTQQLHINLSMHTCARTHTPHVFLEKAYQVCPPLVPSPVSLLDFFPLSGAGLYSPSSPNARRWERVGLERGTGKRWYPASLLPPPASAFFVRQQGEDRPHTPANQQVRQGRAQRSCFHERYCSRHLMVLNEGGTKLQSTQQHQTLFVTMINSLTFCTSCRLQVRGANSLRGEYRGAFSSSFIFALCV